MTRGWFCHCDDCDISPSLEENHKNCKCVCKCHFATTKNGVYENDL